MNAFFFLIDGEMGIFVRYEDGKDDGRYKREMEEI